MSPTKVVRWVVVSVTSQHCYENLNMQHNISDVKISSFHCWFIISLQAVKEHWYSVKQWYDLLLGADIKARPEQFNTSSNFSHNGSINAWNNSELWWQFKVHSWTCFIVTKLRFDTLTYSHTASSQTGIIYYGGYLTMGSGHVIECDTMV